MFYPWIGRGSQSCLSMWKCLGLLLLVIPAEAGGASQQPNDWSSSDFALGCRGTATWFACGGLPNRCRGPGHFSLLAQRKVTTEMVAMPKEKAPRMRRLPGGARKVRERVTGFFDRTSVSCRKNGRHPCRPPCGLSFTRTPLSYGDPEGLRAKAGDRNFFASTRPLSPTLSHKGRGRSAVHGEDVKSGAKSKGRCAARLRFKSSAIRARCAALRSTRCVASHGCSAPTSLKRSGLSQHDAASLCSEGHSLWVTFLLGQQEKSDSSGGSRSKRPPRRRPDRGSAAKARAEESR